MLHFTLAGCAFYSIADQVSLHDAWLAMLVYLLPRFMRFSFAPSAVCDSPALMVEFIIYEL